MSLDALGSAAAEVPDTAGPAPCTVLIVEDSSAMREILRHVLTAAGYRVMQAVDGEHGLELLEGETPDVIVTDINMPRLDGFGLIQKVRGDARLSAIPIMVLTTEGCQIKKDRARQAGADGWMVKPFDPAKLAWAIGQLA